METDGWYEKIKERVEDQKEEFNRNDYNLFVTRKFLRIADRLEQFSGQCNKCKEYMPEVEKISREMLSIVNGTNDQRKDIEEKIEKIFKHMKEIHELVPEKYFTSLFSFIGMIAGSTLGFIAGWQLDRHQWEGLLAGWVVGILIGRIIGLLKDKGLKKAGRHL